MVVGIALNTVVYNEQHRIIGLLAHAAGFCDELIVVDQQSTDHTADLAREFGATVIGDDHHGYCEPSRPLAAAHTRSDWIACLDADEVFNPLYLRGLFGTGGFCAVSRSLYDVARLGVATYVDGVRIDPLRSSGTVHDNRQPRFFRRGSVVYGTGLHTRIEPAVGASVFESPDGQAWVLNSKSSWEQQADIERYAALG